MNLTKFYPEGMLINNLDNQKYLSSISSLFEAKEKGIILESTAIMCDNEHNLIVPLGQITGIIPRKEGAIGIEEGTVRDIALITRVGKPVSFIIEDFTKDEKGKTVAILSRRKVQEKCLNEYINLLPFGSVINAKVTHLETFGAFCDIGSGVIALLPIDSISVSRISHPEDRFDIGDNIKVIIKSKDSFGKITLTHKELLGSWFEVSREFKEGQTVSGIIRSVENYGVFIELAPNLAGLAEPNYKAKVGMWAGVYIKSIIPEKMKVKLIIVDCFEREPFKNTKYYFDGDYMDFWQYSPENCQKSIYTDFKIQ